MLSCLNYSLVLVCYWSQNVFRRVLHIFVLRIGLYFRVGYIFRKVCLSLPFQWNFYLLLFIIDGLFMGNNFTSGTSVTTFTHCSDACNYTPSKPPRKRTIHHWSTLFNLFSYLWNTLISLSTYLLFFYNTILPISLPGVDN